MIGSIVRQQVTPDKPRVSTKFRDAVFEKWKETRTGYVPTLVEQEETWQEFWLYASNTKNWCPRMCALQAILGSPSEEEFKAETLWNFEQGHAYHDLFQRHLFRSFGDDFMGAWERFAPVFNNAGPDILRRIRSGYPDDLYDLEYRGYTDTKDKERRHIVRGWGPPPVGEGWRYVESKVRMLDHRVVVKFDGILRIDGVLEVEELKTEKDHQRDNLDPMLGGAPRVPHVEQVNLAMWATGVRKARIIYLFKGAQSLSTATLEHEIAYDEEMVERLKGVAIKCVDAVKLCDEIKADNPNNDPLFADEAEIIKWFWERFPRLKECPMKSKGRAKNCSAKNLCFPNGYRKIEGALNGA